MLSLCTLTIVFSLNGFPAYQRRERFDGVPAILGPQAVACWVDEHPGWEVQNWGCR